MRYRRFFVFLLLLLSLFSCNRDEGDNDLPLLERLRQIPGLQVTEITSLAGYQQSFQVDITQAVDHADPARGTFAQRFFLSFRGEAAPTVFYTSGYGIGRNYESEPAVLLQANQVLMVHRYFPYAVPSPDDWSFLTIAQAAADQHEIRERLRGIFPGKWVSSGASKGGMTALYYRYFYPDDVDATVAYVAPVMERTEDPRFLPFFDQVGTAECREKLRRFQLELLGRRAAMLALVHEHALARQYSFGVFSEAQALEYSVLEYPFAFWQYGTSGGCDAIPAPGASDRELFDHLAAVSPLNYYADADYQYYRPLFYQAYTEIGYCPFRFAHLAGLLHAVPAPSYRAFAPRGVEMAFRPETMQQVVPWLRHQAERIIYIYGKDDPWTAAALAPDPGLDALYVVQPGANHRVKIKDLDRKAEVIQALERWLQIDIDETRLASVAAETGRERL
ncbi:MAG: aminopeptidase [Candidatus Aminicenantes bacterium]|nr:aminopeptidase [Candidatus Aminicenantes bacterium]